VSICYSTNVRHPEAPFSLTKVQLSGLYFANANEQVDLTTQHIDMAPAQPLPTTPGFYRLGSDGVCKIPAY